MIPQAYTLPDAVLLAESQHFPRHLIWRPTDIVIVLGPWKLAIFHKKPARRREFHEQIRRDED